jgi:hypothetical protein
MPCLSRVLARCFSTAIAFALLLLFLSGCGQPVATSLKREELFSLALGAMEDQIELFVVDGAPMRYRNHIYLKGGRIYITNGGASKIMEFTPFGDLVFLLYNGDINPQPVILERATEGETANRRAQAFPLLNIGAMAVDGAKRIYVEDEIPPAQREQDPETGTTYLARVLRFDRDGNLIDYLGQEGVRGTPFPHIESVHVTARDEPVVVCRVPPDGWWVFWYSRSGELFYRVEINRDSLPGMRNAVPALVKVMPDYYRHDLLMAVAYYRNEVNRDTRTLEAVSEAAFQLHRFSLTESNYGEVLDLPSAGTRSERVGATELEIPAPSFEILGTARNGDLFLLRPEETNQYLLLILDASGREIARRLLTIEDSELFYKDMSVSDEGVITGLLGLEDGARIVWWRSDRLLSETNREGR